MLILANYGVYLCFCTLAIVTEILCVLMGKPI